MAGHSKWKNIMHKKEKTDAQRAKIFTKIGKEMTIAIREGGADASSNSRLRDLITKAKQNNVPNDNIDRIIKKAGNADDITYEEIIYEGYGPSGVAVIVTTATDNRNRTASDLRHYFDKYGGNLGQTGCVSYMFTDKGIIIIEKDHSIDEERLMEDALDAGAEDISSEDDIYEIITGPNDVYTVTAALEQKGYKIISGERDKIPESNIILENEEDIKKMNMLLELLEDNDDVQEVYHNWENREE
ncbi:MAG: YebC/PmpR family DNA-binding transcriptional regulator [Eubacteriales bacterium]|jgi:YebC/PmpR family DNA-binding regulatory protein|nr:YebC/PmpR family DNA-binding transcriptional regulator [Eubacteriales bacterium]